MLCHIIVLADGMPWQMLLPYDIVVDVKTIENVMTSDKHGGRCYCHDVNVADVQNN